MAEPAAVDGVAPGHCPRCCADVSALPPVARYCNRCGFPLPTPSSLEEVPSPPPLPQLFSAPLILLAYGRALFNLGWRYETAIGSRRNIEEAARCYWKAARLGDAAARERYGDAALATEATPHDAPPLPPLPADFVQPPPPPFATVYRPGIS